MLYPGQNPTAKQMETVEFYLLTRFGGKQLKLCTGTQDVARAVSTGKGDPVAAQPVVVVAAAGAAGAEADPCGTGD